ncbi:GAF domain-containing hybrid sensor histidine kinase/response regulator, partial [Rhodopseudomonas palustris]|uniref:GAF domain-containing hybrid sensor histidine kinase/response regulator n=3 Tax=Rhodopseudomonas TaxID=1073 RepID=UPI000AE09124
MTDGAEVQKLLRQQAAIARFGSFALREWDLNKILTEATRACAEGLGVRFSKVCRYRAEENDLLVVAGFGWNDGVVGYVVSRADMSSPQGRAFSTGEPSVCDDIQAAGFSLPAFYAEHGIASIVDVIIKGSDEQPYGILEIDSDRHQKFDQYDINFLTGFANVLAEAVSTASRAAELKATVDQMRAMVIEKEQMLQAKDVADQQLRQAQKMEAVGQLTGGIAHDLNNILTVIVGNMELLIDGVADRPSLAELAHMVDDAATRGADLTQRLLSFARKQPLQPREVDVNALVMKATSLLRQTLDRRVEIKMDLATTVPRALIDPGQLTNAILNLALNARDAMEQNGTLSIETSDVVLDDASEPTADGITPGRYVLISVADNGHGIPADLIDKV